MRKLSAVILIASMLLIPAALVQSLPSSYHKSGAFPDNYLIQDDEPAQDEQWGLDAAVDSNGKYYAVWADQRTGTTNIFFSSSVDGRVWGDGEANNNDKIVNDEDDKGHENDHPSVAVDGDKNLYCAWLDGRDGGFHIRMSRSTSGGTSWQASWKVPVTTGEVSEPYLRVSQTGTIGLVWVEERQRVDGGQFQRDIMFARSTDGGMSFSAPVRINDDDTDETQMSPRLAVSGSGLFAVVWVDYRNGEFISGRNSDIYMSYSRDGGMSFSENIKMSPDPGENKQINPDLAFSKGGDLLIAWEEELIDGWRIVYTMAWTGSDSWDGSITDSYRAIQGDLTRQDQLSPRIGFNDNAFALAWTEIDSRNYFLMRTAYLTKNGEYFRQDHIVDNTIDWGNMSKEIDIFYANMFKQTSIVLSAGDRAQVFWIDYRTDPNPSDGFAEDGDPYTARSNKTVSFPDPLDKPVLKAGSVTWDSIEVKWEANPDINFQAYFLTHGENIAPIPDDNINDARISDRYQTTYKFTDLKPSTKYQFRMMIKDSQNSREYSIPLNVTTDANSPPAFYFMEPDGLSDIADESYTIRWSCSDKEENAQFHLYYDTDQDDPSDQVLLTSGFSDDNGGFGEFVWNTSGLPEDGYTINGTIDDGVNEPFTIYSSAIIVDHPDPQRNFIRIDTASVKGGRESAEIDCEIEITFSEALDLETVSNSTIYLLDDQQLKITGSGLPQNDYKLTWLPDSILDYGRLYTLVISAMITDIEGNPLDGELISEPSPYRMVFRTMTDDGPPKIREYSPQGLGNRIWIQISATFDIPIDGNSVSEGSIKLTDVRGREIPIETPSLSQEDQRTISSSVLQPLSPNALYRVSISPLIESYKGVQIQSAYNWSFNTGDPDLTVDGDSDGTPDDLDYFPLDPDETDDTDSDGIGDNQDDDDDGDGMPDSWEEKYNLNPKDPSDALGDLDNDGKTNLEEYLSGTAPDGSDDGDPLQYAWIIVVVSALLLAVVLVGVAVFHRSRIGREKDMKEFFKDTGEE
ncbi:MAG: Ig-like domain-containing protein [Thermoplasmatota archaeon]